MSIGAKGKQLEEQIENSLKAENAETSWPIGRRTVGSYRNRSVIADDFAGQTAYDISS